jgi:hypothetical protein
MEVTTAVAREWAAWNAVVPTIHGLLSVPSVQLTTKIKSLVLIVVLLLVYMGTFGIM